MQNNKIPTFEEYVASAPNKTKIHYWELPPSICVTLHRIPSNLKLHRRSITIGTLVSKFGKNSSIEKYISGIYNWRRKKYKIDTTFPINLNNKEYVIIYAIMVSEGCSKSEFSLHVPENEFHSFLISSLKKLFSNKIPFTQSVNRNVLRTRISNVIKYLIPIPKHIPKVILKNKEFARIYLRFVFEAEGSPILTGSKRYISMRRSVDVSDILLGKVKYSIGKRIPFGKFKKEYQCLADLVYNKPPPTLVGEHLLLKHYFGINSTIGPECIQINKTPRIGKITAKWSLFIYADSLERFLNEIGFITCRKKGIAEKMLKVSTRKGKFFAFDIIKKIQKNGIFKRSDFIKEMKKYGYKNSQTFLWRYVKKNLIERIDYGIYKIIRYP